MFDDWKGLFCRCNPAVGVSLAILEDGTVFLLVHLHPVVKADDVNTVLTNLTLKHVLETGTVENFARFCATVSAEPVQCDVSTPLLVSCWRES